MPLPRDIDNFLVDRLVQPVADAAQRHLDVSIYWLARLIIGFTMAADIAWLFMTKHLATERFAVDFGFWTINIIVCAWRIISVEGQSGKNLGALPAFRLNGLFDRLFMLTFAVAFTSLCAYRVAAAGHQAPPFVKVIGTMSLLLAFTLYLIACRPAPPGLQSQSSILSRRGAITDLT